MNDVPSLPPPAPPEPTCDGLKVFWRSWLRPFLVVAVLMVILRSSIVDWNVVPTGSMKPTIVEGDYIFVNKLAYDLRLPLTGTQLLTLDDPQRGDIVVFEPPGERERYVKRVVGIPGDILELCDNRLLVNGKRAVYSGLDPTLLPDVSQGSDDWFGQEIVAGRAHAMMLSPDRGSPTSFAPIRVPEGNYFVMGDNRDNSKDSRYFGLVSRDRIYGRAGSVAISLDRDRNNAPRWHRFFSPLH
jgi:signal peptidase I